MGLYDIIDEITEKQVTKTETGDNRIWGVMVGIVVENVDPNSKNAGGNGTQTGENAMDGRICVSIPTRDHHQAQNGAASDDSGRTNSQLMWARVAMPSGGSKWGHYFLPEKGDQVLLAFEGGNIEKPYVIGCIQKAGDSFLSGAVDKDNQFKKITTRNGSSIIFEDNVQGENGQKDKLTLETAGCAHQILMDNENSRIRIGDKPSGNKNYLELTTQDSNGTLTIRVQDTLTIKVGDNITVTMNGASGGISIKASTFDVEASDRAKVEGKNMTTIESSAVSVKSSSSLSLASDGKTSVKGSTLSLG